MLTKRLEKLEYRVSKNDRKIRAVEIFIGDMRFTDGQYNPLAERDRIEILVTGDEDYD